MTLDEDLLPCLAVLAAAAEPLRPSQLSQWGLEAPLDRIAPYLDAVDSGLLTLRPDCQVPADHGTLGTAIVRYLHGHQWPRTAWYELLFAVHHLERGGLAAAAEQLRTLPEYIHACYLAGGRAWAEKGYARALQLLRHAAALQASLPASDEQRHKLCSIKNEEGTVLASMKEDAAARDCYAQAVALARQLPPSLAGRDLALTLKNLGLMVWTLGDKEGAIPLYEEAMQHRVALYRDDATQAAGVSDILLPFYRLLLEAGRWNEAGEVARQALRFFAEQDDVLEVRRRLQEFGRVQERRRLWSTACQFYRAAAGMAVEADRSVCELHLHLGYVLEKLERLAPAIREFRRCRQLLQASDPVIETDSLYAETRCWMKLERPAAAVRCIRRAVPMYIELLQGGQHKSLSYNLRWMLEILGPLGFLGPPHRVLSLLDQSLKLYARLESTGHTSYERELGIAWKQRTTLLSRLERHEEAWNAFLTWIRISRLRVRPSDATRLLNLASTLLESVWEGIELDRRGEIRAHLWEAFQNLRLALTVKAPEVSLPEFHLSDFGSVVYVYPLLMLGLRIYRMLSEEVLPTQAITELLAVAPHTLPRSTVVLASDPQERLRQERPDLTEAEQAWLPIAAHKLQARDQHVVCALGTPYNRSRLRFVPLVLAEPGADPARGMEAAEAIAHAAASFHRHHYGAAAQVEVASPRSLGEGKPFMWYHRMMEFHQLHHMPYQRQRRRNADEPFEIALLMIVPQKESDNSQGYGGRGFALYRYSADPNLEFVTTHEFYHCALNLPHAPDPTSRLQTGDNVMTSGASPLLKDTHLLSWHQACTLTSLPVQRLVERGRQARRRGRWREALECFEEALRKDPLHFWLHGQVGLLRIRAGQVEEGLNVLRQAMRLDFTHVSTVQLGQTLMLMNRIEEGQAVLRQAPGYDRSGSVRYDVASACLLADVEMPGLRQYQNAVHWAPSVRTQAGLASAWHNLNHRDTADRWYRLVLQRTPDWGSVRMRRAVLLADLGHRKAALRQAAIAAQWSSPRQLDSLSMRAWMLEKLGHWRHSAHLLRRCLESGILNSAENDTTWHRLGVLESGLGRSEEARHAFRQAIRYSLPDSSIRLLSRGWLAWHEQPDSIEAAALARQVLRRTELSSSAWCLLALASGDAEARRRYQQFEPRSPFFR